MEMKQTKDTINSEDIGENKVASELVSSALYCCFCSCWFCFVVVVVVVDVSGGKPLDLRPAFFKAIQAIVAQAGCC